MEKQQLEKLIQEAKEIIEADKMTKCRNELFSKLQALSAARTRVQTLEQELENLKLTMLNDGVGLNDLLPKEY